MSQHIDPIDELAELFLTPADAASSTGNQSEPGGGGGAACDVPQRAQRHLLLAGHLPVRGGLWLPPYLDRVASDQGPTCLVQEDVSGVRIQCAKVPLVQLDGLAAEQDLERVVVDLAPEIACWIILVDEQMNPVDLLRSQPDQITLLTSADQAALVAAYRRIKVLALAAQEAEMPSPTVHMAIVGCDDHQAEQMMDRLRATTEVHLGVELHLGLTLPRIDVLKHTHRSLNCEGGLNEAVLDIMAAVHVPRAVRWEQPLADQNAPSNPTIETARPKLEIPVAAGSATDLDALVTSESTSPPQRSVVVDTAPTKQGQWSSLMKDLLPLRQRCPYDQTIELAVDKEGRLNVLGWHDQLRKLVMVTSWASDHLPLLAEACHSEGLRAKAEIRQHLFADSAGDLDDLRRCGFELHLVLPEDPEQRPRCIHL